MLRRSVSRLALAEPGTLVRGFRVDQVMSQVAPTDYVYALQSAANLYTFASLRDADSLRVCDELLAIDQRDRVVHAIFGRPKVPVDFYADIEFPTFAAYEQTGRSNDALAVAANVTKAVSGTSEEGAAVQEMRSEFRKQSYTGESVMIDIIKATNDLLLEHFKVKPTITALFDGGATAEKHSYHLHMRVADAAFLDYTVLRELHSEINFAVGLQAIDLSTSRPNGMLRMAFTPKFTDRDRVLLPVDAKDDELKRLVATMRDLPQRDLMAMSLITRTDEVKKQGADASFRLLTATTAAMGGGAKRKKEYDASGRVIAPNLTEDKKETRYKEACARVASMPMHIADDYYTWIRVGLSLHAFGPDVPALQQWLTFSAKSPHKFDPAVCEKYWTNVFPRRPDCYNWRRGYLFIMKSTNTSRANARSSTMRRKQ